MELVQNHHLLMFTGKKQNLFEQQEENEPNLLSEDNIKDLDN